MKVKTSVMLSEELLKAIEKHAETNKKSPSDFIETAVWTYIRQELNIGDLEIINRRAEYLNQEADDVLTYINRGVEQELKDEDFVCCAEELFSELDKEEFDSPDIFQEIMIISKRCSSLPNQDSRSPEDILKYSPIHLRQSEPHY